MIAFQKNTRWSSEDGQTDFLIVHVNHVWQQVACFDLAMDKPRRKSRKNQPDTSLKARRKRRESMPITMSCETMEGLINSNNCLPSRARFKSEINVPKHIKDVDRKIYLQKHNEKIEERWLIIGPLIQDETLLFDLLYGTGARKKILELQNEFGVHEVVIKRSIVNYFARGGTKVALANDYSDCGSNYMRPQTMAEPGKKRGRPARHTHFRNVTEEDRKLIREHLHKVGRKLISRRSPKLLYEDFDEKYQVEDVTLTNSAGEKSVRRVNFPESLCISQKSFTYELKKILSDRDFLIAEKGEQGYLNDESPKTRRARDDLTYPSQRYEIDATILDCYLLLPFKQGEQLVSGRPVLYYVKDVYSSMIVGIHLAFDGPNWRGVSQALHCAFTDKVKFCAGFGVEITHEMWPCAVVCTDLMIDNGVEYKNKILEALLCAKFGLEAISYARIYMGRDKGGVESEFNRTNEDVIKFIPGYVERLPKKGDKHASAKAAYTYHDLMRLLIMQIVDVNTMSFNPKLHDQHMSEEGVSATPLAVWNYGLKHYADNGRGRSVDEMEILFDLLPKGKGVTSAKGIHYDNHYFDCDHAKKLGWLSDRKERPVKELEVGFFDSSNLHVWYRDPEGVIRQATLSDAHSGIYKGYTWCDATNRKYLYDLEQVELTRARREQRNQNSLSAADIHNRAQERLLKNSAPRTRKMADKILKHYSAMATHNRFFLHLSEVFSQPEKIKIPTAGSLLKKANDNNEKAMYAE